MPGHDKHDLDVRTLATMIAVGLLLLACETKDKPSNSPDREPPAAAGPAEPAGAKSATPAAGSGVETMTPDQVRDEVERAGAEHADKIDKAMDVE